MKKVGLIVIALVLVLGSLGVGYALWTQTINVNGTVLTGDLKAEFAGTDIATGSPFIDAYNLVTYTTSGNNSGTLTVTLKNAYPGMVATIPIVIHNNGSIPIGGIAPLSTLSNLPTDSSVVVNGTALTDGLAVGAYSTDASITVSIDKDAADNSTFVQDENTGYYSFSIVLTSTQFVP